MNKQNNIQYMLKYLSSHFSPPYLVVTLDAYVESWAQLAHQLTITTHVLDEKSYTSNDMLHLLPSSLLKHDSSVLCKYTQWSIVLIDRMVEDTAWTSFQMSSRKDYYIGSVSSNCREIQKLCARTTHRSMVINHHIKIATIIQCAILMDWSYNQEQLLQPYGFTTDSIIRKTKLCEILETILFSGHWHILPWTNEKSRSNTTNTIVT